MKKGLLFFQTDIKTLRTPKNASVFLACFSNRWSVNNRKQFLNIIDQKLVEQPFIPLLSIDKCQRQLETP